MYRLAIVNSHPIQYFAPLYRRLALEPDIDLTVFFCSRKGLDSYYDAGFGKEVQWDIPLLQGYTHEFLPNSRQDEAAGGFFSLVNPAIFSRLAQGNFDAVLIHGHQYATMILTIMAAKRSGTAVLTRCDTHLQLRRSAAKGQVRKPVMTQYYRLLDGCLTIGTRNKAFYQAHGVPEEKLFLVPYAVDNDFFGRDAGLPAAEKEQAITALGLPLDKPLILFVAKLQDGKHPEDLLQAFRNIREQQLDAALVFVGSGEKEALLADMVERHNIPDVYFLGFRNQGELPRLYAIADIFVMPAENEAWGLVINEAMAAGLPIVAAEEIGAVPDLVQDGLNGYAFPTGDVQALTQRLQALVSDEQLRRAMGAKSKEIISEWDFERDVVGFRAALEYARTKKRLSGAAGAA